MITRFDAELTKVDSPGGWTYVVMPNSAEFFGTHGVVKVTGTMDGYPFAGSFMAMGDGVHMLPVKSEIRKALGKDKGDTITVIIETSSKKPV